MDPVERTRRHQTLVAVLRECHVGSQDELRRLLKKEGFPVTQATLSRDLKELRIPCVPTATGYRYEAPEGGEGGAEAAADPAPRQMRSIAALEATGIDSNEVGVVVRTLTGRAQGVAVYLDHLRVPFVLATVAGDDTILVLPTSIKKTEKVKRQLAEILGLGEGRPPTRTGMNGNREMD